MFVKLTGTQPVLFTLRERLTAHPPYLAEPWLDPRLAGHVPAHRLCAALSARAGRYRDPKRWLDEVA